MLSDLRFALRQLVKSPGFTATVIITLALGISACVTIFALVDSVLLRSYASYSDRSVVIGRTRPPSTTLLQASRRDWVAWIAELKSFELLSAHWGLTVPLTGEGEPLQVSARWVTQHYFTFHGNRFVKGRGFSSEEHAKDQAGIVIIAHGLWQRAFGGRNDMVGHVVQLNGAPFTVIGIATDGFDSANDTADVFFPGNVDPDGQPGRGPINVRAWLKPGISVSEARAELAVLAARLAEQYPETNRGFATFVTSMSDFMTRDSRPMLLTLFGAVICVLVIVCANIASLLLVRATVRQRELSVRVALGANRSRIVRQLLTESMLLALTGGAAGAVIAQWTGEALRAYPRIPGIATTGFEMDGRLIAFVLGLTALTALLFGLAPAWLSSKVDVNETLKQGTRGSTEGRARSHLRQTFVILQVAVATMLVVAAGLFIRSAIRIARVDVGLVPENAFAIRVPLPNEGYAKDEKKIAFVDTVLAKIRSLPGVDAAGVTQFIPFTSTNLATVEFQIDGRPVETPGTEPRTRIALVSPGYIGATGIQLLRGRDFSDRDDLRAPRVAIINHTFARQHFSDENPVGQRLAVGNLGRPKEMCEIVGVVADATQASPEQPITAQAYRAFAQQPPPTGFHVIVRSARDIADLGHTLKAQVYAVDPNQPIGPITPLQEYLDLRVRDRRFQLHLLSV
ncbi:MAG: ABC transporter permease, partial [Opitutus sp.]